MGIVRKYFLFVWFILINIDSIYKICKLISKKLIGEQLEDVKDLRYLRIGKYLLSLIMVVEGIMENCE